MDITAFNFGSSPKATYFYNFTQNDYNGTKTVTVDKGLYYILNVAKAGSYHGPNISVTFTGDVTTIDSKSGWGNEYSIRTYIIKVNSGTANVNFYNQHMDRVCCTFQIVQIK